MEIANSPNSDSDTAGVVMRPPFLLFGFLILGHVLDHLVPLPLDWPGHVLGHSISGAFLALGLAVFAAGIRNFARVGTPVPSTQPTRELVTTGIHGWSRNPMWG